MICTVWVGCFEFCWFPWRNLFMRTSWDGESKTFETRLCWILQHFDAFRIFPEPFRHLSKHCPCWRWCSWPRAEKLTPLGTEPNFWGRVTWNHHQITLPVKSMHIWMHMVPWSHYFAHELEFHNNSRFHFHLIFTQPCFVNLLPHTLASLILSFDPHVTVVLSAGWWTFALDHGSWARRVSTGHTEDVSKSNFPNKPMRFFQENNRK